MSTIYGYRETKVIGWETLEWNGICNQMLRICGIQIHSNKKKMDDQLDYLTLYTQIFMMDDVIVSRYTSKVSQ